MRLKRLTRAVAVPRANCWVACNPTYAQRALQLDANVSLVLPCNVTVEAVQDGTRVAAIDPLELMADPVFADLVNEVPTRLGCAIDSLRPAIRT